MLCLRSQYLPWQVTRDAIRNVTFNRPCRCFASLHIALAHSPDGWFAGLLGGGSSEDVRRFVRIAPPPKYSFEGSRRIVLAETLVVENACNELSIHIYTVPAHATLSVHVLGLSMYAFVVSSVCARMRAPCMYTVSALVHAFASGQFPY